jgi:flagellar hook-associated protein 1 FlgK
VGIVNGLLAEIAKTNEYIAKAELVKPFSAVDLRDQRQAKLEELAQYIDVNFEPDTLGQIIVKSGNNELIKGKLVTGQTIDPATGVITGPFSYNSTDRKIKLAAADFTGSGKLSGQLNAAVEDVKAAREQIKDLADQLTTSVNLVYEGVESTKPQFFKKTPANGLLIEFSGITASALRASNTSGGNRMALDIASLATKPFSTTGTPPDLITGTYSSFFNKTVTTLAQELNTTNIRLEDQKLSQEMALNSRDQYSGVSQDEEMTDMMKFQRSFQASARHINVIDTLLEQVVNRLGVG